MGVFVALSAVIYSGAHFRYYRGYGLALDRCLSVLLLLLVVLASGFGQLGTDYEGYAANYDLLDASSTRWWEPGFQLFALAAKTIGFSYDGFVALNVAATLFIAYHACKRLVFNRLLFFYSLYCFQLLSGAFTRQQLAASITFLGLSYACRGKYFLFALSSLVAASIHYSSVIFSAFIFIIFVLKRIRKSHLATAVVIGAVIAPSILDYYLNSEKFLEQSAVYLAENFFQGTDEDSSRLRNVLKYVFYVSCALAATLVSRRRPPDADFEDPHVQFAWLVIGFSAVSVILTAMISPVFSRLSVYLFPVLAVMFGNISPMRNISTLLIYCLVSVLLVAYLFFVLKPIEGYYQFFL